jgi:hypothetical protein
MVLLSCNNSSKNNLNIIRDIQEVKAGASFEEETEYYRKGRHLYKTEEDYLNALYDFDYVQYRNRMLYRCLQNNDFTYFENEFLRDNKLVGNQISVDYMTLIRNVIHIKNNLSFGSRTMDDYYISIYDYYDPKNPKKLLSNEENILLQINSYLDPVEEKMDISELNNIISGIWQKDEYEIYAGYLDALRFTDNIMAITMNEMNFLKRFYKLEGEYRIVNNNIIMAPTSYDYINGGIFIFEGISGDYINEEREKVDLSPNGIISYPIVSLSKIYNEFQNRYYYKLTLFIDRPFCYYKVVED